jgi:ATP-dependent DNA helicase RecG
MRPPVLNPLFASASTLRGIGPKVEKSLAKLVGRPTDRGPANARIVDLLFHLPTGLIDRSARPTLDSMPETGIVTVEVTVGRHRPPGARGQRRPYRIECYDDTGSLLLVFFHPRSDWLARTLPEGERRFVSGSVEWYGGLPQMVHPDHVVAPEEFARLPLVEPVYPLTADLPPKLLARSIEAALDLVPQLPGVARRKPQARLAGFRRGAAQRAPAETAGRPRARNTRPANGSPTTNCWPTSWPWPSPGGT